MPRVAICFFGMNRCLSLTYRAIVENIYRSIGERHSINVFGALMVPSSAFTNTRSNELACTVEDNFEAILQPKKFEPVSQEGFDLAISGLLQNICQQDTYGDNYSSIRNIARELFSVKRSFLLTEDEAYGYYLYVRPDLYYCTPFILDRYIELMEADPRPRVFTPQWQKWSGLNDRIAFCNRAGALVFSKRFDALWSYVQETGEELHAEKLLLHTLIKGGAMFDAHLSEFALRVRANGMFKPEEYAECGSYLPTLEQWRSKLGLSWQST
jgi:hypothetical protein